MLSFAWLAMFVVVCSASRDLASYPKTGSHELLHFNVGAYQGLFFSSHLVNKMSNVSDFSPAMSNKSQEVDVMMGDFNMLYRCPHLGATPAQNFTLATYQMTRMMVEGNGDNCHAFDFNLDLVSIIKLHGHVQVCQGPGSYWSLQGKPCIDVFGMDLGCTELNLSSDRFSYCWTLNAGVAKASVCATVQNNCLRFNGEGCYNVLFSQNCKDFDAEATCW